jgi:hypothetical protein
VQPTHVQSMSAANLLCTSRLEAEGRCSELLDVPQHFDADLSAWLAAPAAAARRAPLRWLHQLRVQDYQQASGTLSQLPQVTPWQSAMNAAQKPVAHAWHDVVRPAQLIAWCMSFEFLFNFQWSQQCKKSLQSHA